MGLALHSKTESDMCVVIYRNADSKQRPRVAAFWELVSQARDPPSTIHLAIALDKTASLPRMTWLKDELDRALRGSEIYTFFFETWPDSGCALSTQEWRRLIDPVDLVIEHDRQSAAAVQCRQ
jgi:hypothetical protein